MELIETKLNNCFIIEPQLFYDKRGYFFESFNQQKFNDKTGLKVSFVQDNQSRSSYGVLRGLHYQTGKFAQAKLVRVIEGSVLDIAVDLRDGSETFGQHVAVELTAENQKQLFVPRGFAHGFVVLSDSATFCYKCDNYYNKESEAGILFKDRKLDIDWQISEKELIISPKDLELPGLENAIL